MSESSTRRHEQVPVRRRQSPPGAWAAWAVFAVAFLVYNSNGREIQSYDSQPTKYAARELALHGRLTLDDVVASAPALAERHSFQRDLTGHFRSAYSVVPSLEGAVVGRLLYWTGLVDLTAPMAPGLIATLTASLLTAAAVAVVFAAASRHVPGRVAAVVSLGLAFGTNLWPLASRSLWQIETVSFGFALALWAWWRPAEVLGARHVVVGAVGLALAGATRLETAPMIAVLLAGLTLRLGVRQALPAIAVVGVAAITLMAAQWSWFGSVMGVKVRLQADGLAMHGVSSTLSAEPWIGAAGLLISPSRGLIAFSPIALIPILALPAVWRRESATGERWWVAAAVVQYVCYACYTMWWGGHTYGPRYLIDVLILLVPAATVGTAWLTARPRWKLAAMVALAWSVAVAAIGAFAYPHERWNTRPADVDRHHQRLWEWRDPQILRCWQAGPSPQNFGLFDRSLIRARPAR